MKVGPANLRSLLDYDRETGELRWRPRPIEMFANLRLANAWNAKYAGKKAFTAKNAYGYFVGAIFGKLFFAHRVAWAIDTGSWPTAQIDHVNGDKADNKISNLRQASNSENGKNAKLSKNNTSGFSGVTWNKDRAKWQARIVVNFKTIHIGLYSTLEEAAEARKAAEKRYGFHANHGLPDDVRKQFVACP